MIMNSIEKIANDIGFDIGNSNDQVQADLLNGFCRAFIQSMDIHSRDMQVCYIVDKLDKKSEIILKQIVEFIKLKDNNNE